MSAESVAANQRFLEALDQASDSFMDRVNGVVESTLDELHPQRVLSNPAALLRLAIKDGSNRSFSITETREPEWRESKTPWGWYRYGPSSVGGAYQSVELSEALTDVGTSLKVQTRSKGGWFSIRGYGNAVARSMQITVANATADDLRIVSGVIPKEDLQVETAQFFDGSAAYAERLIVPMAAGELTVLMARQESEQSAAA